MPYDPNLHHRRSIRLPGYDYASAGAYFITICTAPREHLFGTVQHGEMHLNEFGRIVEDCWYDLPNHYTHVVLDAFVVMPDHVHGIIVLVKDTPVGAGLRPAPTTTAPTPPALTSHHNRHGLPEIVRAFKSFSARRINHQRGTTGVSLWQRNYYEHIVRNDEELDALRAYIVNNPARWAETG